MTMQRPCMCVAESPWSTLHQACLLKFGATSITAVCKLVSGFQAVTTKPICQPRRLLDGGENPSSVLLKFDSRCPGAGLAWSKRPS